MGWQSYHVFLQEGLGAAADAFLVDGIYPEIRRQEESGRLKRFFFIRYSEGGPHLRLRLLPDSDQSALPLEEEIHRIVDEHGGRLESHGYDRVEHYFGETPESVYAELLNVSTTELSLALLQSFGPDRRGERWITLTCLLGSILLAARDNNDRRRLRATLEESRSFALRTGFSMGIGPEKAGEDAGRRWAETVEQAWPQVVAGLPNGLIEPTVRLLRRVRRRGPEGRNVAIHALHLLCNKTGFSLAEEHETFATLAFIRPFSEELS